MILATDDRIFVAHPVTCVGVGSGGVVDAGERDRQACQVTAIERDQLQSVNFLGRSRRPFPRDVVGVQNLMRPTGTRDGGRLGQPADAVGYWGSGGIAHDERIVRVVAHPRERFADEPISTSGV